MIQLGNSSRCKMHLLKASAKKNNKDSQRKRWLLQLTLQAVCAIDWALQCVCVMIAVIADSISSQRDGETTINFHDSQPNLIIICSGKL